MDFLLKVFGDDLFLCIIGDCGFGKIVYLVFLVYWFNVNLESLVKSIMFIGEEVEEFIDKV